MSMWSSLEFGTSYSDSLRFFSSPLAVEVKVQAGTLLEKITFVSVLFAPEVLLIESPSNTVARRMQAYEAAVFDRRGTHPATLGARTSCITSIRQKVHLDSLILG